MNNTQRWIFLLLLVTMAPSHAETRYRYSSAYANGTDRVLYTEEHTEIFENDKIVEGQVIYRDSSGNVFAEKHLDYRTHRYLPEFRLDNRPPGHQEITVHNDGYYEIIYRNAASNEDMKERLLPRDGTVADAGFDRFIIDHWQEIIDGETLRAGFLVPSMQKFIDFRIYQQALPGADPEDTRVIVVEPDSFLVRLLADRILLEYEYDQPVLKTFTGISNLRDDLGKNYQVRIEFSDSEAMLSNNTVQ